MKPLLKFSLLVIVLANLLIISHAQADDEETDVGSTTRPNNNQMDADEDGSDMMVRSTPATRHRGRGHHGSSSLSRHGGHHNKQMGSHSGSKRVYAKKSWGKLRSGARSMRNNVRQMKEKHNERKKHRGARIEDIYE